MRVKRQPTSTYAYPIHIIQVAVASYILFRPFSVDSLGPSSCGIFRPRADKCPRDLKQELTRNA